jgi:hypothetical protein
MSSLVTSHYDKPSSHSSTQTVWRLPARRIYAPSMKILDLKINPNTPAYFSPLVGAYGCIKRIQLRINGVEADLFYANEMLPYLLCQTENELQKGLNGPIFGQAVVVYDQATKLLKYDRPLVDANLQSLNLTVYLNLLKNIGVIEEPIELIITWHTNVANYLCPVNGVAPTTVAIDPPYLSYETIHDDKFKQPASVVYNQFITDNWLVPAISADNTTVQTEVRSNAFNGKLMGRLMLSTVPQSIQTNAPAVDVSGIYNVFGPLMSFPQKNARWNIASDGIQRLTMRGVQNESTNLSIAVDAFGHSNFVSTSHYHSKQSPLLDLSGAPLNGFAAYSALELNEKIYKELQLSYSRMSDTNATFPSLASALVIVATGEVKCLWNGTKNYL